MRYRLLSRGMHHRHHSHPRLLSKQERKTTFHQKCIDYFLIPTDHTCIRLLIPYNSIYHIDPQTSPCCPPKNGLEERELSVTKPVESCPIDHIHQLRSHLEEKGVRITLTLTLNLNRNPGQHHKTRMEQQQIILGE